MGILRGENMPTPGPKKFTVEEICERWNKLYDEPFTPMMIRRMGGEGQVEIESRNFRPFPAKNETELVLGKTIYFMTRKERDRFEAENPPDHQKQPVELAPKTKISYLRLIGYMADRLAEKDSLDIDKPYVAADQILLVSEKAGKMAGSKNFISTTIREAKKVWEDSDTT
jgi:hypothetical protein